MAAKKRFSFWPGLAVLSLLCLVVAHGCGRSPQAPSAAASPLRPRGSAPLEPVVKADRAGTTIVVLIGVNHTTAAFRRVHGLPPLQFADADVEILGRDFKALGVNENNIFSRTGENATVGGIMSTLEGLSDNTKPEDTVIVFFGGHGIGAVESAAKLVCYDGFLSVQELLTEIGRVGAGKCILLMDACHAGSPGNPAFIVNSDSLVPQTGGLAWISSAEPEHVAYEVDGHGLFSSVLSSILQDPAKHDHDKDGWLEFAELAESVQLVVESQSRELGGLQRPTFGTVAWQDSANLLQVHDSWKLEILEPAHRAGVRVTFPVSEIPPGHHLWLVVYPHSVGGYWPQPHVRLSTFQGGETEEMVYLGMENGTGIGDKFTVALVEADTALHDVFLSQYPIHDGFYDPPFSELPIRAEDTVIREH